VAERPSDTYRRIYAVVRRIPRGRVATYGQVAALAGFARQPRLAGYALHALRDERRVPWHRVLNAQGRISLMRLDGGAGLTQRLRLEQEGVCFTPAGRVDLKRFGWRPGGRRS
jgi:methylated-DNA-protein-cysteine methyltransferase-like protein